MQVEFQVIRDGSVIFKLLSQAKDDSRLAELTSEAISKFRHDRPGLSLFDEQIVLKWVAVETSD